MKKFFALILALAMALSLVACGGGSNGDGGSNGGATTKMRFVTGGESGTYYAFGSVIAQHATNNAGIDVVGLVGNGSQSNVQELQDGNAELAFCQSDVMAYAYNGTNIFADHGKVDCFSTVAALYMEQVQIVTVDPTIKTVEDLAGKKVSVGAAGSGVYFNAKDILTAYGLGDVNENDEFTQINATYQSFGDSANDLKDGKIDAAFIVAGAPTTAVTDLATTKDVHLVSLDDEHIAKLLETSDYYTKTVFEIITDTPNGELTVCGGGRYDGLVEEIGGPSIPAVGFGMGIERVLMLLDQQNSQKLAVEDERPQVFVACLNQSLSKNAFLLMEQFRRAGLRADMDHQGRSLKAQFKYADKLGAQYVAVLGDDEVAKGVVKLRNMQTRHEWESPLKTAPEDLKAHLEK